MMEQSSRWHHELNKTYNKFCSGQEIPLYEERGVYNMYLRSKSPASCQVGTPIASVDKDKSISGKRVSWADLQEEEEAALGETKASKATAYRAWAPLDEMQEEEIEVHESRKAIPAFDPGQPSQKEIDEHEASGHAVFRSWCQQCIEGWGLGQRHARIDHSQDRVPVISHDFYYMSPEEDENRPYLAMIDSRTKMVFATALENKRETNPVCSRCESSMSFWVTRSLWPKVMQSLRLEL